MANQSRSPRFYLFLSIIALFVIIFTFHTLGPSDTRIPSLESINSFSPHSLINNPQSQPHKPSLTRKPLIPRLIWQTWQTHANIPNPPRPDDNLERLSRTWTGRNPYHTYTRLESNTTIDYIHRHYAHRADIISTFEAVDEPVLRADMIRYLVLSSEGGVYSDMDTECIKSIDLWSGEHDFEKVGMILGLEYDQRQDSGRMPGTSYRVQFSQWTMASKPGHPVMELVRDKVFENVGKALGSQDGIQLKAQADVFDLTGPRIFTAAVREGISAMLGREVEYSEFSMLPEPTLFGDVLVLPIDGFASGVPHSGAREWGNEQQLVGHQFKGEWKTGLTGI
ncbi:Initiation-specific alpha-1,6-mannosyltransferase [Sphaceloma murrayae]|uniref:Initiation-specific alpha-1,6-mannosyltransferase n=1 Tax=Sphaceloma murrayae TaxID=2082308 RepID=A0A2K1QWK3_9PEZI|nr:Initiation-specific alpha-1,6-mannosyltransferase [Sphaceloma murrayae]